MHFTWVHEFPNVAKNQKQFFEGQIECPNLWRKNVYEFGPSLFGTRYPIKSIITIYISPTTIEYHKYHYI